MFLAFRDLWKRGARGRVVESRSEVDKRSLHATDGLSNRRWEDRRERHPDRTGVVGAHPTGELDEFAGEYDARLVLREDVFDLLARDAVCFARGKAFHDPTRSWRFAATERDFNAGAFGEVGEFRGKRVGEPVW